MKTLKILTRIKQIANNICKFVKRLIGVEPYFYIVPSDENKPASTPVSEDIKNDESETSSETEDINETESNDDDNNEDDNNEVELHQDADTTKSEEFDSVKSEYEESRLKKHWENVKLFGDKLGKFISKEWQCCVVYPKFDIENNEYRTGTNRQPRRMTIADVDNVKRFRCAREYAMKHNGNESILEHVFSYILGFYDAIDLLPVYDITQNDDGKFSFKQKCSDEEKNAYLDTIPMYMMKFREYQGMLGFMENRCIRTEYVIIPEIYFNRDEFNEYIIAG